MADHPMKARGGETDTEGAHIGPDTNCFRPYVLILSKFLPISTLGITTVKNLSKIRHLLRLGVAESTANRYNRELIFAISTQVYE